MRPTSWLSVVLLASVVLGAWVWSDRVSRAEDELLQQQSNAAAIAIETLISERIAARADALTRWVNMEQRAPTLPLRIVYLDDATHLLGFESVGWFLADGTAFTSSELDADPAAEVADAFAERFSAAGASGRARVISDGDRLWFGAPRFDATTALSVVVAPLSVEAILEQIPDVSSHHGASVTLPDGQVFYLGVVSDETAAWGVRHVVDVGGQPWHVSAVPSAAHVSDVKSSLPAMIFIVGVLLGSLCAVVIRAMQMERTAAHRAKLATMRLAESEAEVRALNAGLEERVAERTAELQRSNGDLEQFAYAASHDLQEPLRMVISYLQLIERRYGDRLDDRGRQFVHFAVDGGLRMRELVKGLLRYSRVGRGKIAAVPVPLDRVMDAVRANLEVAIDERNATLDVEVLPTVSGDEALLTQLFQNLVSNSLRYCEETPVIRVRGERLRDAVVVSVEDNGIGIPADAADRIFELFQRLHRHNVYEGTGLGLAVCKRISELHGGEVALDVDYSPGARFVVRLPRGRQTATASMSAIRRLEQSG